MTWSPVKSPYAEGEAGEPTRILVVDDNAANRRLLKLMLKQAGFRTLTAKDGLEAVEAYTKLDPDLILMDVTMPEMDGMEATRLIKEQAGERFIPVIFVTALTDQKSLSECLAAGGDDFVSKPLDRAVLLARVETQLRTRRLYWEQYKQRRDLAYFRDMVETEQRVAEKIFSRLDRRHALDLPSIRYRLSPMSVFNGDLLLAARTPLGRYHLLIGDFTGHGLAAAIGALPTSDIFYTMTSKGYGLPEIIGEINERLRNLLPTGMFLGVCALEISSQQSTVSIWCGGIPDVLIRRAGGGVDTVAAQHLPLGIVSNEDLGDAMTRLPLHPHDLVILYTDGVIEAENPQGELYGSVRLHELVREGPGDADLFERIIGDLDRFRAGHAQSDDLTLLQFESLGQESPTAQPFSAQVQRNTTQWRVSLYFHGDTFRAFDPRPVITQLIMEVQGLHEHKDRLYTLLSELFSNALEHGLLGLDSGMKATPEGFARYYQEREARLKDLDEGWIRIEIRHRPKSCGGELVMRVEDSGEGFDHTALADAEMPDSGYAGRGLTLLQRLADEVVIYPPGNQVQVTLYWS